MPRPKKTVVHVNQHIIRANTGLGVRIPPLTVKDYAKNRRGSRVVIRGPCEVVYSPDKPLKCGAQVWIQTTSPVEVFA